MMGFEMRLEIRPPRKQSVIKRYDRKSSVKFDDNSKKFSTRPYDPLFSKYNKFALERAYPPEAPETLEAVALADINLKTRKQIGLVLGSVVRELYCFPSNHYAVANHRDLDVLLLFQLSNMSPRPSEWGIDWWVKPRGNILKSPTNGRVNLWYDITLKAKNKIVLSEPITPSPVLIDTDNGHYEYLPDEAEKIRTTTQAEVDKLILKPGLYVPHPEIMRKIVEHCNHKKREDKYSYLSLDELEEGRALYPVMPPEAVNVTLI